MDQEVSKEPCCCAECCPSNWPDTNGWRCAKWDSVETTAKGEVETAQLLKLITTVETFKAMQRARARTGMKIWDRKGNVCENPTDKP